MDNIANSSSNPGKDNWDHALCEVYAEKPGNNERAKAHFSKDTLKPKQITPLYKKPAVSPGVALDSCARQAEVKMYEYASPIPPYASPYDCAEQWAVNHSSGRVNPLGAVSNALPNFDASQSPAPAKVNAHQPAEGPNVSGEGGQSVKSSSVQTANFEGNDAEYIALFDQSDESSSIHSATAIEVSTEFVKNDYLSLKGDVERSIWQKENYLIPINFYKGNSPRHLWENERNMIMHSLPFANHRKIDHPGIQFRP